MNVVEQHHKHPDFILHTQYPINGNVPLPFLVQEFVTPDDLFFARNHGAVPEINPSAYRLTVDGLIKKPLSLTLEDIQQQFPKTEVMATLQCAGNRRQEFMAITPIADEVAWGGGAISNAVWGGVRLRDVLIKAGTDRKARHAAFSSADQVQNTTGTFGFGGSIPMEKALMPETLLAYEMNGKPLPPLHGSPLRVIVPGYIGARSVKWLTTIRIQPEPSDNYFQQRAYKLFPPDVTPDKARWEDGIMMGENSLNAVICYPVADEQLVGRSSRVMGYALGDGYHLVEKVELSTDDGQTWTAASFLTNNHELWAWRLWEAQVELHPSTTRIIARATDSAGNTQPRDTQEIWNFKGYGNNAWHRLKIKVRV